MKEDKRTDRLFEQVKPELLRALSTSPSFGVVKICLHFLDGRVKRVVHQREESVIPGAGA